MAKKNSGKKLGGHVVGGDPQSDRNCMEGSVSEFVTGQVKDIWKRIGTGEIDLSYACTYVTYSDYRPVYDEDVLTTLLLNYGYRIDSVLAFLDQFVKSDVKPVVIMDERKAAVYAEVKPLKGVPGK